MLTLPTRESVIDRHISKGDLARELFPGVTFDCAIPQLIANGLESALGYNPTGELIFVYTDRFSFGLLVPLTSDVAADILEYSRDVGWDTLDLLMNWDSLGIRPPMPATTTRIVCNNGDFDC